MHGPHGNVAMKFAGGSTNISKTLFGNWYSEGLAKNTRDLWGHLNLATHSKASEIGKMLIDLVEGSVIDLGDGKQPPVITKDITNMSSLTFSMTNAMELQL